MMDKPPWINEVKEIDREEAIVLLSLGVPVFMDFVLVGSGEWDEMPDDTPLSGPANIPQLDDSFIDIFYVKPGETNESTS